MEEEAERRRDRERVKVGWWGLRGEGGRGEEETERRRRDTGKVTRFLVPLYLPCSWMSTTQKGTTSVVLRGRK